MSVIGALVPAPVTTGFSEAARIVRGIGRSMGGFTMLVIALLAAVALGLGSAWWMIERGSPLTVDSIGPWRSWTAEGNPEADPYTRAHVARNGRLSVTSNAAHYYLARTDSDGRALTSTCEYLVEGPAIAAKWWSLTLFDGQGHLIGNGAKRHGFNSAEAVRQTDGGQAIHIARHARPGNWLPSGETKNRDLLLWLSVFFPSTDAGAAYDAALQLPEITRLGCG